MQTYRNAAENGAALLDEKLPGWYRYINLKNLDVMDGCKCISGQLGAHFLGQPKWLKMVDYLEIDWDLTDHYGFSSRDGEDGYDYLTSEWTGLILRRLEFDAAVADLTSDEYAPELIEVR